MTDKIEMTETEMQVYAAEVLGYDATALRVRLVSRAGESKIKVTHSLVGTVHFIDPPAGAAQLIPEEEGDGGAAAGTPDKPLNVKALKTLAKSMGLTGYSSLKRPALEAMIEEASGGDQS